VDQVEGNGLEEWAAMEKRLCKVVDLVDKCRKLCRTGNNEADGGLEGWVAVGMRLRDWRQVDVPHGTLGL
jgi:hypothetical protein